VTSPDDPLMIFITIFTVLILALVIGAVVRMKVLAKKRREALAAFAKMNGFKYQTTGNLRDFQDANLPLFSRGHSQSVLNQLRKSGPDREEIFFDYRFIEGMGKSRRAYALTVALFRNPRVNLPAFTLEPEHVLHRIAGVFGYQDIDIPSDPEFSRLFFLRGKDEARIRLLFSPSRCRFLCSLGKIHLEANEGALAIHRADKEIKADAFPTFVNEARRISDQLR